MSLDRVGDRIRTLRRRLRWTLADLADRCGYSVSLISKIETGKTMPPVATLAKIGQALGVTTSALLGEGPQVGTIYTAAADLPAAMTRTAKGYCFAAVASQRADKLMQPLLFEARKGRIRSQPLAHSGEEFIYVLEGQMRYRVGVAEYTLGPGDSLYFDAEQPHELAPVSDVVRFLAIFVERTHPAHPLPE